MANKRVKRKMGVREQSYTKLRNRLLQNIRRAEKRGYRFTDKTAIPTARQLRQQTGKAPTQKALKELERKLNTYLESAQAVSQETGKVITGTERRAEERRASARKGAETRRKRLEEASKRDEAFEIARYAQDAEERERLEKDKEAQDKFNEGVKMWDEMQRLIESAFNDPKHTDVAQYINEAMQDEIATYGYEPFMMSLGQSTGVIEKLQNCLEYYRVSQPSFDNVFMDLMTTIRGTVPTAEEAREWQDKMDEFHYWE